MIPRRAGSDATNRLAPEQITSCCDRSIRAFQQARVAVILMAYRGGRENVRPSKQTRAGGSSSALRRIGISIGIPRSACPLQLRWLQRSGRDACQCSAEKLTAMASLSAGIAQPQRWCSRRAASVYVRNLRPYGAIGCHHRHSCVTAVGSGPVLATLLRQDYP
jgi:hypothetical protein